MRNLKNTFAAFLLLFVCSQLAAQTVLNPVADAYVRSGPNADNNYGSATTLEIRASGSAWRTSFLKFDISGISGNVIDATLRINANTSGSVATTGVHPVTDTSWSESVITWNNQPTMGASLDITEIVGTAYDWYELDVTEYVATRVAASASLITLALENADDAGSVNKVRSKEASSGIRPELIITVSELPEKPGPGNTGYTGTLTSGSIGTVTTDNAVFENLDVTGGIKIQANNVTIRNCRITGGLYGIQCNWGYTGLLIEDCEIRDATSAAIYGGHFTARRLNIHDSENDAIKVTTDCLVESSWIHHLGTATGSHADGVQSRSGGSDMTFRWNNFDMPITDPAPYKSNATFIVEDDEGDMDNILIEENWLNGGNYTIYSEVTGMTVRNNLFGRDYRYGIQDGTFAVWTGNVWEDDGEAAP